MEWVMRMWKKPKSNGYDDEEDEDEDQDQVTIKMNTQDRALFRSGHERFALNTVTVTTKRLVARQICLGSAAIRPSALALFFPLLVALCFAAASPNNHPLCIVKQRQRARASLKGASSRFRRLQKGPKSRKARRAN